MGFKPGNQLGGRKKGSKNKRPQILLKNIEKFLHNRFKDLDNDWDELSTKERWRLFTDLAAFTIPKKQANNTAISFDQLPEEALDQMIEQLKQTATDE